MQTCLFYFVQKSLLLLEDIILYTLTCKFCGKEFESRFPQGNVCSGCKVGTCIVCGKTFNKTWPYDQKTCSAKCRKKYAETRDYSEINEARAQKMIAKYGVDNVAKLDSVRGRIVSGKKVGHEANKLPVEKEPVIRICKLCGQEFEAKGSQEICSRDHFKGCPVCGRSFKIKSRTRQTCSNKCAAKLVKLNQPIFKKVCKACGKEFETTWSTQIYCNESHMKICPICQTEFDISSYLKSGSEIPKTCGNLVCKKEFSRQTCLQKYGVEVSSQSNQAKAKLSKAY